MTVPPPTAAAPVIFDLDGTLVDSEPNYYEAGRQVLAEHGVNGFSWAEHSRFVGIGTRETLTVLRERYGVEASVDELLAAKNRIYLRLVRDSTEVFPEMRKLVELLHADGHPLAVASGSSRTAIDASLTAAGLDPLFPVRVSAEEAGRGKPAPDVFLAAARRLGAAPERCVVVEDAVPGVQAARRAGMRCIAVPYLPASAADPALAPPVLVFPGGQREFDAERARGWIRSAPPR